MAYFANGTEGEIYFERWCSRCEFLPEVDDRDCPIRSAHFFYNYDREKNAAVKDILDMLIPMRLHESGAISWQVADECSFFRHRTEPLPFDQPPSVPAVAGSVDEGTPVPSREKI